MTQQFGKIIKGTMGLLLYKIYRVSTVYKIQYRRDERVLLIRAYNLSDLPLGLVLRTMGEFIGPGKEAGIKTRDKKISKTKQKS